MKPHRTPAQVRRVERQLVIAAALKQGLPQRLIARTLGISQARVSTLAARFEPGVIPCRDS